MTTNTGVHTCSYYCERPECIKRQRDELRDRMEAVLAQQPPSAPAGVDFAAVASILRRALRDGAHYGYRRDFILQQALALEALSQQPAARGVVDDAMVDRAGQALYGTDWGSFEGWEADQLRRKVRAVLTSALAAQQQGGRDHG